MQFINLATDILFVAIPIFIAMGVFWVYKKHGGHLTADVAFPAIQYLRLLIGPIMGVPSLALVMVTARVSLRRIQAFIDADEAPPASQPGAVAALMCDECFPIHVASDTRWARQGPHRRPQVKGTVLTRFL